MSKGILLFCFDSEATSYHRLANYCILRIKKELNLPVAVVSNETTAEKLKGHDHLILAHNSAGNSIVRKDQVVPWFNLERSQAYDLTPFDHTVLLDCDYFVYSDYILQLLNSDNDFLLHNRVHDLTNRDTFEYRNKSMLPLVWATLIVFKKSDRAKRIFEMVQYVKQHYSYFCSLYRIDFRNFRNDYAFAIALNQLEHNDRSVLLPTKMNMLPADSEILELKEHGLLYKYNKQIGFTHFQDVHVIDKELPIYE